MMSRIRHITWFVVLMLVSANTTAQSDACAGATLLTCGSVVAGSTTAFGADVAPFCGTGDGTGGGVWFRFVGTGTAVTASLCGSGYDTKIRVFTGGCAGLVCTTGIDDFCGLQSSVTWTATTGVTYWILVHGFGAATGNYTLTLTCAAPPVPLCYSMNPTPYLPDPFAGTAVTLTDDVHSAVVPIGFSFCFNGTTYTQCVISSNNYVTFDLAMAGTYSPWVTVAVPTLTPTEVRNAVLNPWQDIHPGVGGNIYYQTVGVAPNRRFVVSYLNVPMFSCTSQLYTSQTILYETSNCIGSHITTKPICTTWNNGNAVHGLHNAAGTSATVVAGRNNTQWAAAAQGMYFVPTCTPCSTAASATCITVLPLEMLHFQGRRAGSMNLLEWATASEENTAHFTVERSADGDLFGTITSTAAAGNSHQVIEYAVKDMAPLPGTNYYRLRTTDLDGQAQFSDVISVTGRAATGITIFPNPASGISTVQMPDDAVLPAVLHVRDLTGRLIWKTLVAADQASVQLPVLASGSYQVDIEGSASGRGAVLLVE